MKIPLLLLRNLYSSILLTLAEIAIELKPFWHEHEYDYPSFRECIFMALKEDFMYVNWDGRTFLSCQNDGVYILFSTLGARQNTLFLTPPAAALEEYYSSSSELRVHFNFSSLSNWARLLTQLQLLLLIFLTKDSERANVVVTILGILYIINHR